MGWEPWTGCYKVSEGCTYCYYYGPYSKRCGWNSVTKTDDFYKPLETEYMPRKKLTKYKLSGGKTVPTCFTTDFFIEEADEWRLEAWSIIKQRPDLNFLIVTKRIDRFYKSLPEDWGGGYENVTIGCTVENQEMADYRLPLFLSCPIKHKILVCTPLLSRLDVSSYLHRIESVTVGGETGREAREFDYGWALDIREQCINAGVKAFWFKTTGSVFRKDGVVRRVNPKMQHRTAREFGLNIAGNTEAVLTDDDD